MTQHKHITACPDCDLLIDLEAVPNDFNALCPRCQHVLHEAHPNAIERGLALSIAGLLLFPFALFLPLMTLSRLGLVHAGSIAEGIIKLYSGGYWIMATLVLVCAVIAPLIELSLMFIITSQLWLGRQSHVLLSVMRLLHTVREWAMLEVLMMGIMVSLVKLKDMATLEFNAGLLCMILTLLSTLCIKVLVNEHELWEAMISKTGDNNNGDDNIDRAFANDVHSRR